MADKHPYVTAPGYLVQVLNHLKKSFPQNVTAETLKKLGYAPNNESYVLNTLRYLGLIDQDGNKTPDATKIFSLQDNETFSNEFGKKVSEAYKDLFNLFGDNTWNIDSSKLITFFMSSDDSTERVGKLKASTFRILASFAGYGETKEKPSTKQISTRTKAKKPRDKAINLQEKAIEKNTEVVLDEESIKKRDIGLSVRIEINLPADGTQETYDRIFKSIRENLLNG